MLRLFALGFAAAVLAIVFSGTAVAGHRWGGRNPHNWVYPLHARSACKPYDDHEYMITCMNRPVPPGYIIMSQRHAVNCPGLGPNAWIIQKLPQFIGAELVVCANQPIPDGWGVVNKEHSGYCPGHDAVRIRKMH